MGVHRWYCPSETHDPDLCGSRAPSPQRISSTTKSLPILTRSRASGSRLRLPPRAAHHPLQLRHLRGDLRESEPIVAETFAEADRVMTPLLGRPLSEFIFIDHHDPDAVAKAEEDLRQTAITQPAVLATDLALTRLLASYGITPDFAMGHSLGEYGALVAVDALPFADALEAVSARGREMTQVSMADNGRMAAVFAPLAEIERILETINGYVVIANINSNHQAVIGGSSQAVEQAMTVFQEAGYEVAPLAVSHAFHTSIVAPASEPLRRVLEWLHLQAPRLPIIANTNGEFYPTGENVVPQMLDILAHQVAAPVQFVKGLHTLYEAGARVFIEVGPKRALQGFVEDVLGERGDVVSIFSNHPRVGDVPAFNQALCALYAAGLGAEQVEAAVEVSAPASAIAPPVEVPKPIPTPTSAKIPAAVAAGPLNVDRYDELGRMFADVLDRGWQLYKGRNPVPPTAVPVGITGAALGLPGTEKIFDDANIARILRGDQFIDVIPTRLRNDLLDKHITRLVKSDNGNATFESITSLAEVIKLAGRGGEFDMEREFGVSAERLAALDRVVHEPEAEPITARFEGLRNGSKHGAAPQIRYALAHTQRDLDRVPRVDLRARRVRDAAVGRLGTTGARASATPAPLLLAAFLRQWAATGRCFRFPCQTNHDRDLPTIIASVGSVGRSI